MWKTNVYHQKQSVPTSGHYHDKSSSLPSGASPWRLLPGRESSRARPLQKARIHTPAFQPSHGSYKPDKADSTAGKSDYSSTGMPRRQKAKYS